MRRRLSTLFAVIAVLSMVMAVPVAAEQPVRGDMDLYFNVGFTDKDAPCPHITWAGTITFDGEIYGMVFIPTDAKDVGKVHHFWEDWIIYDTPFAFTGGVLETCTSGAVVMEGIDKGVFTAANGKYRMNGAVTDATGPFAGNEGRQVHMSGVIELHPEYGEIAPGIFRLN